MELGTLLVLLAIVLAVVGYFVSDYAHRLLTAAVIIGFIGVLVGVGDLVT